MLSSFECASTLTAPLWPSMCMGSGYVICVLPRARGTPRKCHVLAIWQRDKQSRSWCWGLDPGNKLLRVQQGGVWLHSHRLKFGVGKALLISIRRECCHFWEMTLVHFKSSSFPFLLLSKVVSGSRRRRKIRLFYRDFFGEVI